MYRFTCALTLVLFLSAAPMVFAADTAAQKAPTCSEQAGGGKIESIAKDVKTAIEQSDKTSHDSVIVTPEGQVSVISQCNPECIQGKLRNPDGTASDKPCPAGSVRMTLPNGVTVSCSKETDACGKAVEGLKSLPEMAEALRKGDTQKATQLATDAFRNIPEIQAGLQKAQQDVLNSAFSDQLPAQYQAAAKGIQKGLADSIKAIADGDLNKLERIGKELSQNPAIQEFTKDPQNFLNGLLKSAPAEMQQMAKELTPFVCSVFGGDACAQVSQITGTGFSSSAIQQPQITWPGGSSPYLVQQRAALMSELDSNPLLRETVAAVIATEKGGGGPGSQAVLESMVNRCVQMDCTSLNKAIYNGFYGPVNRGEVASYLARGVSASDMAVAEEAIQAVRGGSNLIEFRTDQGFRNEVRGPRVTNIGGEWFADMNGNASWAAQQMQLQAVYDAAHPDAVIPASTFLPGNGSPLSGGVAGPLAAAFSTMSGSPLGLTGSFAQSLGSFIGSGGNPTSLLSGLFGGSSGGFNSILSSLGRLFGGSSGSGSSSGSSASSGTVRPPTATIPPSNTNTGAGTGATTVVKPVISIAQPGGAVQKGDSFALSWAAVGVSTTNQCQLLDANGVVLKVGNSGSYTMTVPVSTTAANITFELRCVPKDTRVAQDSARKTISVSIR